MPVGGAGGVSIRVGVGWVARLGSTHGRCGTGRAPDARGGRRWERPIPTSPRPRAPRRHAGTAAIGVGRVVGWSARHARGGQRPRGRPLRRRSPTATGPVASARGVAVPARPGAGTTRPCRRIVHGQIEGVHVVAALPSVVGRRIPVGEGRSAGVGMPDPTARDADRVDVERQALDGAWIFQLRDDAGDAPIVATGDDVQRLVVVERLDRFGEPYGDVVGVHHAR
jgi:hypothetical protein